MSTWPALSPAAMYLPSAIKTRPMIVSFRNRRSATFLPVATSLTVTPAKIAPDVLALSRV